jgi:hypothetical protein
MIEIIDCEQGTDEWIRARCGIPTASMFGTIMANGRGGGESLSRREYMMKLAGEIITGQPMENYSNRYMQRGKDWEAEARAYYAFLCDEDPVQVGFIRNGNKGCSPDSLIGNNKLLEIKTHAPHLLIPLILKDEFPPKHQAQTQGQLWVAERDEIDLFCFFKKMPPFKKTAYRDSAYIRQLSIAVSQFNDELNDVVEKVRAYGGH